MQNRRKKQRTMEELPKPVGVKKCTDYLLSFIGSGGTTTPPKSTTSGNYFPDVVLFILAHFHFRDLLGFRVATRRSYTTPTQVGGLFFTRLKNRTKGTLMRFLALLIVFINTIVKHANFQSNHAASQWLANGSKIRPAFGTACKQCRLIRHQ